MSAQAKTAALEALVEAHTAELHLPTVRRRFRQLAAEATREQQTPLAYLAALLEAEVAERAERRERRRLLDARFPIVKRLEDFRFDDNPNVPQAAIAALAEGSWIDDRESVILSGENGSGKTHLATALAVCACRQGRRVRFTTLAALANELQEAESRRELARVVARYARIELLVLDELGYLALPAGTPTEAAALIAALRSEDRALWGCAFYAGLRRGELRALLWNDIDIADGLIRVERSMSSYGETGEPKSRAGRRGVPIVAALGDLLVEYKLVARRDTGLVFGSSATQPFTPAAIRKRALTAWRRAELDPIGLHECRHTFASLLIAAGVNAKATTAYLGHASIQTTLDLYGHLMPGNEDEAVALVDAYLERSDTGRRLDHVGHRAAPTP